MDGADNRRLKLGIVGIGVGASEILPAMEQMAEFNLVAAADVTRRDSLHPEVPEGCHPSIENGPDRSISRI